MPLSHSPPIFTKQSAGYDYPLPRKACIRTIIKYNDSHKIEYSKNDVFRAFGYSRTAGYRALRDITPERSPHDPPPKSLRGRKGALSKEQKQHLERVVQEEGFNVEEMTWKQLAAHAGFPNVHKRTIQRYIEDMHFHRCPSCLKGWVSAPHRQKRLEFALKMLNTYTWQDWMMVRWSDEAHFGLTAQGQLQIIRRPGERDCYDCYDESGDLEPKYEKRYHCWAVVGYNYKSPLVFYDCPEHVGMKLTQNKYISTILEPHVLPCLERGDHFILEEDSDWSHGSAETRNPVRVWKENKGLRYYFNPSKSPDLSLVEDCLLPVLNHCRSEPRWDEASCIQAIQDGWDRCTQSYINGMVCSYPDRLQKCVNAGGAMTGG